MEITGIEGLSRQQLRAEVDRGGRFVVYGWCVSFLILTLKRSSDVTFVRADQSRVAAGLGWTLLSVTLGWWGFPWGFIYTPMVLIQNLGGGTDVTDKVMASLGAELGVPPPSYAPPQPTPSNPAPAPAPLVASPPSSPNASRDVVAVVMSALSLACCAPLGWVAAVLAILSIRDAQTQQRPTPVISIVTLVLSGLSTLLLVAGGVAFAMDQHKASSHKKQALSNAVTGRLEATLGTRTACALAQAALYDGVYERRSSWDTLRCETTLGGDAATPTLELTAVRGKLDERLTACFARSNRRWFVLAVRHDSGCPEAPALTIALTANEKELESKERAAQRKAEHAPPKQVGPRVQPRPGGDEAEWPLLELEVTNVATRQQPSDTPPFHKPGGDWTYFDLAPLDDPTAKVRVGLKAPSAADGPVSFSELRLAPKDRDASTRFIEAVADAFLVTEPTPSAKPRKLVPVKLATAVLGQHQVRAAGGGFSSPKQRGAPGTWTTTKLFLERNDQYAEVYFNVDLEAGVAELSEKDSEYREPLVGLLTRALLDGW